MLALGSLHCLKRGTKTFRHETLTTGTYKKKNYKTQSTTSTSHNLHQNEILINLRSIYTEEKF